MLSAAASLGMILLWDVDGGLTQIDKYLYSSEDYIKVLSCGNHTHTSLQIKYRASQGIKLLNVHIEEKKLFNRICCQLNQPFYPLKCCCFF